MENKELKCIEDILAVIKKYGFDFSEEKAKSKLKTVIARKDSLWVIKRIHGILKNANSENAERKIEDLKKFLSPR